MRVQLIAFLVFLGGGLGSLARFALGQWTLKWSPRYFPWGTLVANVTACFILGCAIYGLKGKLQHATWIKYLIVTGFCGGFSTFSAFSRDTLLLFQQHYYLLGALNIVGSLVLGIGILMIVSPDI